MSKTPSRRWRRIERALLACGTLAGGSLVVGAIPAGGSGTGSLTWSTLSAPASPPALRGAAAAYDGDSGTLILFGGETAGGQLSAATWLWNGTTWTLASPTANQPAARQQASMAFDAYRHQLILFGGVARDGTVLNDTWAWNGASWFELSDGATGAPPAREGAVLGYDGSRDLVLFGGTGAAAATSSPPSAAPSTSSVPSAPSPTTAVTVPPAPGTAGTTTSDTGTSDASATGTGPATPGATTPGPSASGAGGSATTATPTSTSANATPSGTDESTTQPAVLDDTWLWNGSAWEQQFPTTIPPARTDAAATSDAATHGLVIFGGATTPLTGTGSAPKALGDTWQWSDGTWVAKVGATHPPARYDATLSYDPDIGAAVLFGGTGGPSLLADTWTWNGSSWTRATISSPSPRGGAVGVDDVSSRQLVVFGGLGPAGALLRDTAVLTATKPVTLTPTSTSADQPTSTSPGGGPPTTLSSAGTTPGEQMSLPRGATTATSAPLRAATPPVVLPPSFHRGDLVIVRGAGFRPGTKITITFHSVSELVGTTTVRANGTFTATVAVPTDASGGMHRFEESGLNSKGQMTSLWTPIRVVSLPSATTGSMTQKLVMVGIAVAFPAVTWLVLSLRSRLRQRGATGRGAATAA